MRKWGWKDRTPDSTLFRCVETGFDSMSNRLWRAWLGRLPTIFAGLCLLLVMVNGVLILANRSTQIEVNGRVQYLNQTVQLERVLQTLAREMATSALSKKNDKLNQVLEANGIRYEVAPAAATDAGTPVQAPAMPSVTGGR